MTALNIVVISGGRGSISLQEGIRKFYSKKNIEPSFINIVNAYDDGLSTGIVRKLVPGGILGPSDVRKVQFTQYSLIGGDKNIQKFFNLRFKTHDDNIFELLRQLAAGKSPAGKIGETFKSLPPDLKDLVSRSLEYLINLENFKTVCFDNFSLANLLYAGLAGINGNDLQAAEAAIRSVLHLPDAVILNSTENFWLSGLTEDGLLLYDEAHVVNYKGNSPIYEVFLSKFPLSKDFILKFESLKTFEKKKKFMQVTCTGKPQLSIMAAHSIAKADVIVYSPGTQYSSLYPTYLTQGLAEALCRAKAVKIMVTNITHDNEIPDFRAVDIIRQAAFYLNQKGRQTIDITNLVDVVVVNDPASSEKLYIKPNRTELERIGINRVICEQNLEIKSDVGPTGRHNPHALARIIDREFNEGASRIVGSVKILTKGALAFDLDDTLFVDRRKLLVKGLSGSALNVDLSNLNLISELLEKGFKIVVLSGNDFEVIHSNFVKELINATTENPDLLLNLTIYADGSTTKHSFDQQRKTFEIEREYSDAYCIKKEHRTLIGKILNEAMEKLNKKYPSLKDVHEYYDPRLFSYKSLPKKFRIRGDYSQIIIKPIPSDRHCYPNKEARNDRRNLWHWIRKEFNAHGLSDQYEVLMRGWGTIEVQDKHSDKYTAIKDYIESNDIDPVEILYFGNELDPIQGNDFPIAKKGIYVIAVSQDEATLPKLPNIIYGGHRGTASTSFHLEHLLETYEKELSRIRTGKLEASVPATSLYINKLLEEKLESELIRISNNIRAKNIYLTHAISKLYEKH